MESFEELESAYLKQIEDADKYFLDNVKGVSDRASKEKAVNSYREKLAKAQREFEGGNKKLLLEKGVKFSSESEEPAESDEEKKQRKYEGVLSVEPVDLGLSKIERFKLRFDLFKFRSWIKIRDVFFKTLPRGTRFYYFKMRLVLKERKGDLFKRLQDIYSGFVNKCIFVFNSLKEVLRSRYVETLGLLKSLLVRSKAVKKQQAPEKQQSGDVSSQNKDAQQKAG